MLNALKKLLQNISASVGKIGSRYDEQFKNQLESHIALAEKFIQETTGVTGAELARAAAGIDTQVATQANTQVATQANTQVSSAENAQTTDTATATPKENLSVAPAAVVKDNVTTEKTPAEQTDDVINRQAADYEQRFGTVINTDNAKLLFKDDGYDPHDAESVKKFHPQASAIIRKLFDKFLKERKGKGNGLVVFTGGGNGSGKSSVMNDQAIKNADFVFDSAMVNYEAAKNSIQQVINNGQTPLLAFVYRNPADAWFNGVQKRNQSSDGHIVPEGVFANTHAVAKETFLKLVRDFGDNVQYIIKEVADGKASEITLEELENKPKYTKDQIKEAIYAENEKRAKAILDRFSNQETDNQGYSSDGRSTGRGDRGVSEKSAEGVSGSVTSAESINSKITSAKAGSRDRIMAFTELPDGEHTINGNAFTLDGKTLNAKEIEKATRTTSEKIRKTAEETMTDSEVDYTPKSETQPAQKPTTSDNMRGKGKKKAEAKTDNQSEVSEKSDAFVMKDGKTLKNGSGETVLIYHDKSPKGALWGNKKFKSENHYGTAQYVIIGDDVHIRMTNSFPKTGKRYMFFTIPDFRNKTISEMQQAIQKIAPDSTYPLGRNFDDLLHDLHDHGMRVYPSGNTILFSKTGDSQQDIEEVNRKFNDDLDRQIAGTLPKGYIHQLGTPGDILLGTGVPNLPIELSARQLKEKADTAHHPFDINDVRDLPKMLQKPIGVFSYGDKNKAQNIIVEVQKDGKNFIVGLSLNFQHDGLVVNSIRGLYPKDLHEWLTWIQDGKSLYLNKEKVQNLIAQQRRNLADVSYLDLNSINNIIQNFENPSISSKNPENSSGGVQFSKPGDGFTDPESTQTEVEEKIDRESEKLTDPELTAEEREKRKEVIRTESSVILGTLKHFFGWKILGIKKARSSYYTDDRSNDITLMGKLLRTPIWLAKKFKGTIVESIVNAALTLSHDKNNIFQYLGGETSRKIKKFRSRSAWFRILYDVRT